MRTLAIEGYCCTISCPCEDWSKCDHKETAVGLIKNTIELLEDLSGENKVVLLDEEVEEYIPPRCRKPRPRIKRTKLAEWSLAEIRAEYNC